MHTAGTGLRNTNMLVAMALLQCRIAQLWSRLLSAKHSNLIVMAIEQWNINMEWHTV